MAATATTASPARRSQSCIEALARLAPAAPVRSLRQGTRAQALRAARTCYDHLAGRLGVDLMAALIAAGHLTGGDGTIDLAADGPTACPRTAATSTTARPGTAPPGSAARRRRRRPAAGPAALLRRLERAGAPPLRRRRPSAGGAVDRAGVAAPRRPRARAACHGRRAARPRRGVPGSRTRPGTDTTTGRHKEARVRPTQAREGRGLPRAARGRPVHHPQPVGRRLGEGPRGARLPARSRRRAPGSPSRSAAATAA